MEQYIVDFLAAKAAQEKSKCTIKAYSGDLAGFAENIGKPLNEVRYADLQRWINAMAAGGLSPATRARKISAVKSFYRWMVKMELMDRNPADAIDPPKLEKKEPKVISAADASEALFLARNDGDREKTWYRNYAIFAVIIYTGIRREELTNIKLSDVDMAADKILIHGKGNKQRTVFINATLHAVLSEYMTVYRPMLKPAADSEYLFPSSQSEKMSVRLVNEIVNSIMDKAGIKERGMSAHALRKRFATSAFEATGDIATVSKMLGHSSPTVTMRYVRIDENKMRDTANVVSF